MIRYLPFLVQLVMLVYCLIDCVQTDRDAVRNLPRAVWVVAIIALPLLGGIAWLVWGRPARRPVGGVAWRATTTAGFPEYERPAPAPSDDIDERLRREQERVDREHDEAVRRWEATRRRQREDGD